VRTWKVVTAWTVSRTGRDEVARRLGGLNPGMARRCSILNRHDLLAAIAFYDEAPKYCSGANRDFSCGGLEFEKRNDGRPIIFWSASA
jgi:hypothetical protein